MFSAMITVKFDSVLMVVWIMSFDFTGTSVYFYEHSKTPRPKSLTQGDPAKKKHDEIKRWWSEFSLPWCSNGLLEMGLFWD
mmetsp:Transcript_34873/g.62769  ORF Transcript_34873/g.62769 Transcript_34873/m.62769 type:complete len:81 (-) Transcript_34873:250-492(-)